MAIVPVPVPGLPVLWSKAVVDLEPMTRYGSPADVASVNSTLCLHNPDAEPREVTLYAPAHWENEATLRVGQEARKPASRSLTVDKPRVGSRRSRERKRGMGGRRPPMRSRELRLRLHGRTCAVPRTEPFSIADAPPCHPPPLVSSRAPCS